LPIGLVGLPKIHTILLSIGMQKSYLITIARRGFFEYKRQVMRP